MILKGILDGISDGIKSALCFTDRAYIKINGKRIKRITTSDIIDNIFQENIGNEIELSTRFSLLFGTVVYSVKESNGEVNKTGILNLLLMGMLRTLCWLICYGIIYGIFYGIMFANDLNDSIVSYIPMILFLYPIYAFIRDLILRNKLK